MVTTRRAWSSAAASRSAAGYWLSTAVPAAAPRSLLPGRRRARPVGRGPAGGLAAGAAGRQSLAGHGHAQRLMPREYVRPLATAKPTPSVLRMTSVTSHVEDRLAHRTVLVADDSEAVRTAFQVLLSLHGARVLGASSPAEALATVRSQEVDLVIQDMNFRREATSRRGRHRAVPRVARAAPGRAGHPAHRLDAPRNRRRPREGRRRRLHRQALGRRAAADDGAQPARAARRGRGERRHARAARAKRAPSSPSATTCAASSTKAMRCIRWPRWPRRWRMPTCRC